MRQRVKPIMGEPFDVNEIPVEEEIAGLVQGAHDAVGAGTIRLRLPRGNEHLPDRDEPAPRPQDNQQVAEEDPINPSHYRRHPSGIECIEVARHLNFNIGNAIKYLWRYQDKGDPVENLKKAMWYIDDEVRRLQGLR